MGVRLPRRARESHKGDYGRVGILAGKVGFTGAPVLAAEGALRGGAGLVYLGVPQAIYPIVAAKCLCAMPFPLPSDGVGALKVEGYTAARAMLTGKDAVLLGPGLGDRPETAALVRQLTEELTCPLVLDADGINALRGHIDILKSRRSRVTVLTPHQGEFARLLGREMGDREEEARAFARTHGCVLVLKGHRTVTAFPDGRTVVNTTGNPGMATGGSGDVLAGLLLALLGQGFGPERVPDGVRLHGRAGDLAAEALGEYAMTAADLLTWLPAAMKEAETLEE